MTGTRGCNRLLWRWRRNPLRRRSDLAEAWLVLVAWLVAAAGAVLASMLLVQGVHAAAEEQRAERESVPARLLVDTRRVGSSGLGPSDGTVVAPVQWSDAAGHPHRGNALVPAGAHAGSEVRVWTDSRGGLTAAPMSSIEADYESAGASALAAVGWCLVVAGGTRVVRWRLDLRRMHEWDREWADTDRRWRRRTG